LSGFAAEPMANGQRENGPFLATLVLLAGMGLATLWSSSSGFAISLGKPAYFFLVNQLVFYVPALAAFAFLAFIPLDTLRAKVGPITLIGLASLLLPFVPGLGENRNGASRWVDLGFTTLQPSEFWKPICVIYLAHILDRRKEAQAEGLGPLILPFFLAGAGCLLILLQNNLSTAIISGLIAISLFWVASAPAGFFIGLAGVAIPLAALSVLTSEFRLRRILTFLVPAYAPHGQSYQVLGSLRAIRSGGFFGKGVGLGTLKLGSVPEVQSDFIFAAWTEEMGFIGVLAFLAIWAFFCYSAYRRAFEEEDGFRSYLGFGLTTLLALEVVVNVAVSSGLVPATGIALPFFSAGGSSLLATGGVAGLLVNLSRPAARFQNGDASRGLGREGGFHV
jgi:cell division protein FtsW